MKNLLRCLFMATTRSRLERVHTERAVEPPTWKYKDLVKLSSDDLFWSTVPSKTVNEIEKIRSSLRK